MANRSEIIRPFLFSCRLLLWISAVITLGLTAWVVDHLKGYRAVFSLVIVRSLNSTCELSADSAHLGGAHYGILHSLLLHLLHASQPWVHASTRHNLLCTVCLTLLHNASSITGDKLLPYRTT